MSHDHSHADEHVDMHAMGEVHEHPTLKQYWKVAVILTLITVFEVWVYYTSFAQSRFFVPVLLIMSALKFTIVVLYYMHLKYDHRLFKALFTGPLIIAMSTLLALMFLFSKLPPR